MDKLLFGYDKHNKAIYDQSIIKFFDTNDGRQKVGHLWFLDWDDDLIGWIISFNHLGSETSQKVNDHKIINIIVIGYGQDDEYLLEQYWNH